MKKILVTTGGTGGHVIPATILHEHLVKEANVIISIDKRGLKYLEKDYKYKVINTPKLNNILFCFIPLPARRNCKDCFMEIIFCSKRIFFNNNRLFQSTEFIKSIYSSLVNFSRRTVLYNFSNNCYLFI